LREALRLAEISVWSSVRTLVRRAFFCFERTEGPDGKPPWHDRSRAIQAIAVFSPVLVASGRL